MTTSAMFNTYANHLRSDEGVPILGFVCWYTVTEEAGVQHSVLTDALVSCDLAQFTPAQPRDDDVFRRVSSAAQQKRVPVVGQPDVFENFLIRDVKRQAGQVWKQIVVEQVDGANKRLGYEPAVELMFDSTTSGVTVTPVTAPGVVNDGTIRAMSIARDIVAAFNAERGRLNAYAIREMYRRIIMGSDATICRPGGGVYFVLKDQAERMDALDRLAQILTAVSFHTLPLVDDARQRTMVKEAFEDESVGAIDKMIGEMQELLSGPEITSDKAGSYATKVAAIKRRAAEYADLLDEKMGNTEFRLAQFESHMKKLLNHVKID